MGYPWYAVPVPNVWYCREVCVRVEENCQTKERRFKVVFITGHRGPSTCSGATIQEAVRKAIAKCEKPGAFSNSFKPEDIRKTKEKLYELAEWAVRADAARLNKEVSHD